MARSKRLEAVEESSLSTSRPAELPKTVGLGRCARPTLSSTAGGYLPKGLPFHEVSLAAIRRKSGTATVKTAEGL
jgi:hypothetical protein